MSQQQLMQDAPATATPTTAAAQRPQVECYALECAVPRTEQWTPWTVVVLGDRVHPRTQELEVRVTDGTYRAAMAAHRLDAVLAGRRLLVERQDQQGRRSTVFVRVCRAHASSTAG